MYFLLISNNRPFFNVVHFMIVAQENQLGEGGGFSGSGFYLKTFF